jgi:hypothetical protein
LDLATSKKFEPFSLVSATVPWTANCMQFLELSAMFFHGLLLLMHPNTKNPSLKGKPQKKKKKKRKKKKAHVPSYKTPGLLGFSTKIPNSK